ncbi:glycoside hydrolase family 31 protein [Brachybacterium vulturis]|nr:glycoside hydrolase family 31 protein [Brachybacterium vulturis]
MTSDATSPDHAPEPASTLRIPLQDHERWWGGRAADAHAMPYGTAEFARDLAGAEPVPGRPAEGCNQASPLLISSTGRRVQADGPFRFRFREGELEVTGAGVRLETNGQSLRSALQGAADATGPVDSATTSADGAAPADAAARRGGTIRVGGPLPDRALFTGPQYNSWIEQPFLPTQDGVLDYVRRLLDAGLPPGVVMIDDMWSADYGNWTFDAARFPDPAHLARTLHDWGCRLMLWVVPYISPDSPAFRRLEGAGLLLRGADGHTALRRWWNGVSAVLDLSEPQAVQWFHEQADALCALGVDGFKFDGADVGDFRDDDLTGGLRPVDMCRQWSRLAARYPLSEMRASWDMGGQPLAQRVQDTPPAWGEAGIVSLIPRMIAQSLMGYAYCCPDMVGGGEISAMQSQGDIDQEFFVRYAQVAALAPMIQFSASPARVLDEEHLAAVRAALRLREHHLGRLLDLAEHAARTGEPILRPMAYHHPGLEDVRDQFMLGEDLVVAPVLERGARSRRVILPAGTWTDAQGRRHEGPTTIEVDAPLEALPVLLRA